MKSINDLKNVIKATLTGHSYNIITSIKGWKYAGEGCADRSAFLAYAYLRGKAYRAVEPTARDLEEKYGSLGTNLPLGVAAVVNEYSGSETVCTAGDITAWMAVPETDVRREKREKSLAADRARRDAYRAKFAPQAQVA